MKRSSAGGGPTPKKGRPPPVSEQHPLVTTHPCVVAMQKAENRLSKAMEARDGLADVLFTIDADRLMEL